MWVELFRYLGNKNKITNMIFACRHSSHLVLFFISFFAQASMDQHEDKMLQNITEPYYCCDENFIMSHAMKIVGSKRCTSVTQTNA